MRTHAHTKQFKDTLTRIQIHIYTMRDTHTQDRQTAVEVERAVEDGLCEGDVLCRYICVSVFASVCVWDGKEVNWPKLIECVCARVQKQTASPWLQ